MASIVSREYRTLNLEKRPLPHHDYLLEDIKFEAVLLVRGLGSQCHSEPCARSFNLVYQILTL